MKLLKNVLGSIDNVFDVTPILVLPLETESFAAVCKAFKTHSSAHVSYKVHNQGRKWRLIGTKAVEHLF